MVKIVTQTYDIPEDIYRQIPHVLYDHLSNQLNDLRLYAKKLVDNKRTLPKSGTVNQVKLKTIRLYVSKSPNDPFNIEYLVVYRFMTSKFNEIIYSFLKVYNLKFDIGSLEDRSKFFADVSQSLSSILDQQVDVKYDIGYIVITAHAMIQNKKTIHRLSK